MLDLMDGRNVSGGRLIRTWFVTSDSLGKLCSLFDGTDPTSEFSSPILVLVYNIGPCTNETGAFASWIRTLHICLDQQV